MNNSTRFLKTILVILVVTATSLSLVAQTGNSGQITIIAVDGNFYRDTQNLDTVRTLSLLSLDRANEGRIGFTIYGASSSQLEIIDTNNDYLANQINFKLRTDNFFNYTRGSNISALLTSSLNELVTGGGTAGSKLIVITNSDLSENFATSHNNSVAELFSNGNWQIEILDIGSGDNNGKNFSELATITAGSYNNLSKDKGFVNYVLGLDDGTELPAIFLPEEVRKPIKEIQVVPYTSELVLDIISLSELGGYEIFRPDGVLVDIENSRTSIKTPQYAQHKFTTPLEGRWTVEYSDTVNSSIWVQRSVSHPAILQILSSEVANKSESYLLEAGLFLNDIAIADKELLMNVDVTYPNGSVANFMLNDNGQSGDTISNDGVYSTLIPVEQIDQSRLEVTLKQRWKGINDEVKFSSNVEVINFPTIEVEYDNSTASQAGSIKQIATINAINGNNAYSVTPDSIMVTLKNLRDGKFIEVTKVATETGKVELHSLLTLSGNYEFNITLNSIYKNVPFTVTHNEASEFNVLSSPSNSLSDFFESLLILDIGLGIPLWTVALLPLLLIPIYYLFRIYRRQTKPHGILVDSNMIIDFSTYKRGFFQNIFRRSSINGSSLFGKEYSNVNIIFSRTKAFLVVKTDEVNHNSLRINGLPPESYQTELTEGTKIGVAGKIMIFYYKKPLSLDARFETLLNEKSRLTFQK